MDGQRREQRRASLMGTGDPPSLPELNPSHRHHVTSPQASPNTEHSAHKTFLKESNTQMPWEKWS